MKQDRKARKMLAGNLSIGKIEELAKLAPARFVSLVRR
jgi:hypothetical protein